VLIGPHQSGSRYRVRCWMGRRAIDKLL
jgi:hypothetical protein